MENEIQIKLIESEMKTSYIDYAMSVIMQRALPDVRDGLKPVHRRILYSMYGMGLNYNKPFVKSARIVGECFKYHPHGDASIYDSLVRMAQNFSLRYTLIKGHGNFGSDSFNAAHMRYTEAKLERIGEELLQDIDKNTVDFAPNFDGSLKEPVVLPSKIPNLLINGTSGIAVGMASNIPPHNISEVIKAIIYAIENENFTVDELMNFIKGPDFPTGALILGSNGIRQAYKTGRGKIKVRSKVKSEKDGIIVYEIPYMVNKSLLIENIAELVKNKTIEGISDLRDESSRNEIRIVIELKKGVNSEVILNNLYRNTQLETSFGINMVALYGNEPRLMNLRDMIYYFIEHRRNVVTRRTRFELDKTESRKHIIEGILIALDNIDNVVELIKKSKDINTAKENLISNYNLSEKQSIAILEMRLQRLTSLEQDKIKDEHKSLIELIKELKEILDSEIKLKDVIKKELNEMIGLYKDERRTEILNVQDDEVIEDEDLIKEEDIVITFTNEGYIKSTKLEEYKQQKRGGKGLIATTTKEEDYVTDLFVCNNLSNILFFTNEGRIHWLKAYQIPLGNRYSKGKAVINLIGLGKDEKISSILSLKNFNEGYLIFCTKNGILKKSDIKLYSNPRKGGINAITLKENDEVVDVLYVVNNEEIVLGTKNGLAMRLNERDVKSVGRSGSGVIGIRLKEKDYVIGMVRGKGSLFTVTENGFGKRTNVEDFRLIRRGGKGVLNIKTKYLYDDSRNEGVVGIKNVFDDDELMFITKNGITIRVKANQFRDIGRNTSGIRLIKLDENDKVVSVAKVVNGE